MKQFFVVLMHLRLLNLSFAIFATGLGSYIAMYNLHFIYLPGFYFTVFAVVSVMAAGNIWNDLKDIETDTINKPGKVYIPQLISRNTARHLSFILFSSGVMLSLFTFNIYFAGICIFSAAALLFYPSYFKPKGLAGNVLVAFLCALPVLCGALIIEVNGKIFWVMLFAFLVSLIREIVKDVEDRKGDAHVGMKTFIIRFGMMTTKKLCIALSFCTIFAVLLPVYVNRYGNILLYNIICLFLVHIPLLTVIFLLKSAGTDQKFHRVSSILKGSMIGGMIAMLLL